MLLFRIYRFPLKVFAHFSLTYVRCVAAAAADAAYHITQLSLHSKIPIVKMLTFFFSIVTWSFSAYFIVLTDLKLLVVVCEIVFFFFSSNSLHSTQCVDGEIHCEWQWLHTYILMFQLNWRNISVKLQTHFGFKFDYSCVLRTFLHATYALEHTFIIQGFT